MENNFDSIPSWPESERAKALKNWVNREEVNVNNSIGPKPEHQQTLSDLKGHRDKLISHLNEWKVLVESGKIMRFDLTESTMQRAFAYDEIETSPLENESF